MEISTPDQRRKRLKQLQHPTQLFVILIGLHYSARVLDDVSMKISLPDQRHNKPK